MKFPVSSGQTHDAPEERKLLSKRESQMFKVLLLMDGVYEGDENQEPIKSVGLEPVVFSWIGRAGKTLGNTMRNCIRNTMKRRGCSGG